MSPALCAVALAGAMHQEHLCTGVSRRDLIGPAEAPWSPAGSPPIGPSACSPAVRTSPTRVPDPPPHMMFPGALCALLMHRVVEGGSAGGEPGLSRRSCSSGPLSRSGIEEKRCVATALTLRRRAPTLCAYDGIITIQGPNTASLSVVRAGL
jgi:hypothetical protein